MLKTLVLLSVALFPLAAAAAEAPPPSAPPAAAEPENYVPIVLTEDDMKMLSAYLGKLPYDQAAPLVRFFTAKEADARLHAKNKP
jgi:hypothetical protein